MPLQTHEIPTVVIVDDTGSGKKGVSTSVIFNSTEEGVEELPVDLSYYNVDKSDIINTLLEFIVSATAASYDDLQVTLMYKELNELDKNTLVNILIALKNLNTDEVELEIYLTNYLQKVINDTIVSYRINLGKVPAKYDTDVEMYIWGTRFFNTKVEAFSAAGPLTATLDIEVDQATGRISKLPTDIFATVSGISWLDNYICNSAMAIDGIDAELTTISGRIRDMETDIFSTRLGLEGGYPTEFKTRSLFTGDFFLERDKFTTASSIAWVDVIDFLYPINTDNTYLSVNGTTVSGVWFEDIPNGKRLYYDPLNDFYSDGVLTYSLHAESSIGEVEEKDFYLLYGYNLEPNQVIDWGPNNRVVVRVEAQNLVFCPNKEGEAFDFVTSDLTSFNLKCTINPVGYVDLPVSISPQSTVFYYGKTYTIKLRNVKDFAGNVMPDFEYTFTIEDPLA